MVAVFAVTLVLLQSDDVGVAGLVGHIPFFLALQ